MHVEGSSGAVDGHTPEAMLTRESPWLASKSPARAVFVFSEPTRVASLFVRNAGSSHVEVDAMVEGDGGQWATLVCSAQLLNEKREMFLARFFTDQLSKQLQDARIVKLRVTLSSELTVFGLAAFVVNVDEEQRKELRDAGAGRAPDLLASLGATPLVPVVPLPAVTGKGPAKPAPKEPKKSPDKKPAKPKAASAASKKAKRIEIDLEDDDVEDVEEIDFAPLPKKVKSTATKKAAPDSSGKKAAKALSPSDENNRKTILKGVVFGLSGLENPERSIVRDMAVGMGASYAHNWGKDATHLLLACAGTPKHKEQQASNHGVAVHYKWVTECDRQGKRVAEDEFLLGKKKPSSSSPPTPAPVSDVSLLQRKASSHVQTFPSLDDVELLDDDVDDDGLFPHLPDFLAPMTAWIDVADAGVADELKRKIIGFGGRIKTDSPVGCTHFVTDKEVGGVPGARTVTATYIETCCAQETLL